ncbi:hypothetical protein Ahy_A08g037916 isoform B [Arachis hypogaea]|uniref:Uncharacterized protein n=1 Tax=Arachis hypogaea TaxID=3818 RepID=A0A445BS55_ARAHY|nr:hypothetical protein Ahy_A08g037916 isoform B [Arachis hypogaea]
MPESQIQPPVCPTPNSILPISSSLTSIQHFNHRLVPPPSRQGSLPFSPSRSNHCKLPLLPSRSHPRKCQSLRRAAKPPSSLALLVTWFKGAPPLLLVLVVSLLHVLLKASSSFQMDDPFWRVIYHRA